MTNTLPFEYTPHLNCVLLKENKKFKIQQLSLF
jgi:hypothetical protein